MEKFFDEVIDKLTASDFLEMVRKKYHYEKEQLVELKEVAEQMLPLIRREACWNQGEFAARLPEGVDPWAEGPCREVVLTLGEGTDLLQEEFTQKGLLSESYMVEALASELLLQGYAAYNKYVEAHTEFHVARYHFLGSEKELPIESLEGMPQRLGMPVQYNEAFCMIPKKSVAFVAELTLDAKRRCQGICVGCGSKSCPNRMEERLNLGRMIADMTDLPLSYGYSRIFGRR